MSTPTAMLTVSLSYSPESRYCAGLHLPDQSPQFEWFNWPADLNKYVQRARKDAKRQGYDLVISDETGEVR